MKSKPKTYDEAIEMIENNNEIFGDYIVEVFEDYETLALADDDGWTVAHEQASFHWTTEDKRILKLADKNGMRVAHTQAHWSGWTTTDPDILALAMKDGWTVADEIKRYKHEQGKWLIDIEKKNKRE